MNRAGGVYIAPPVWYHGTTNIEECIMVIKEIVVTGDTGNDYRVSAVGDQVTCECPAYQFSSDATCKHIRFIQTRLV